MKDQVANNWGAVESIVTSVSGFLSTLTFVLWRQSRLEKQQDLQAKEDKCLSKEVQALALEVKESTINANTKAMENMSSALHLIADSNGKLAETVVNQTKLLDKMDASIDTAFNQIRAVERDYVSKDHFDTFKESCKQKH